jgi:hypothetical protein
VKGRLGCQTRQRFNGSTSSELLHLLKYTRQSTVDWLQGLDEGTLTLMGRHPVLGGVNVEIVVLK